MKEPYILVRRVLQEGPEQPPKRIQMTEEDCVRAVAM
jgi:hypothetical protein